MLPKKIKNLNGLVILSIENEKLKINNFNIKSEKNEFLY